MADDRMYTIPGGVQSEAKKALEWRKKHKRGGTPVGLNTARTLAKGGQIGIRKIRHIAKYFPRHEVDKKGKVARSIASAVSRFRVNSTPAKKRLKTSACRRRTLEQS